MSKIIQLRYNIKNQLKISRPESANISDRQIDFMIDYIREKLLVQHIQKGRSISANIKQDLGNVELTRIQAGHSDTLLRSKVRIPQPIELDYQDAITYVGGLNKRSPIPFVTRAKAEWNMYNKYTGKNELSYYDDGHIYISGCKNPNLKYINVEGIFLHPKDVSTFVRQDGTPAYNEDTDDYPLSGRFIDMMNTLIKGKELDLFVQIAEDSTNNADIKS